MSAIQGKETVGTLWKSFDYCTAARKKNDMTGGTGGYCVWRASCQWPAVCPAVLYITQRQQRLQATHSVTSATSCPHSSPAYWNIQGGSETSSNVLLTSNWQSAATIGAGQSLRVHSPGSSTFLREIYDFMAAILKVWRQIENRTPPSGAYLLEDQSCQISSRSDSKRWSLRLFWRGRPNRNNKKNKMKNGDIRSVPDLKISH